MQRVISLFLLILFLFSVAGYYLFYFVCDAYNRKAMQNELSSNTSLLTLRFHKNELKNIIFKKQKREFMMNGEMYDLKSMYIDGDHVILICKHDRKETKLLAGLSEFVKKNSSSSHDEKQPYKLLKYIFFSAHYIFFSVSKEVAFVILNCNLPIFFFSLNTPPPENAFLLF